MRKIDKKTQIKIFNIILIVVWMITIFVFSGQQGTESGGTSRKFTVAIIQIITGKRLELNHPFVEGVQFVIRKLAHFTIYAIGGFLIMNYTYSIEKTMKQKILFSIVLGETYAITDEIHQFFVPGRSAQIFDVCIDTLGLTVGVFVYLLVRRIIRCIKRKVD